MKTKLEQLKEERDKLQKQLDKKIKPEDRELEELRKENARLTEVLMHRKLMIEVKNMDNADEQVRSIKSDLSMYG